MLEEPDTIKSKVKPKHNRNSTKKKYSKEIDQLQFGIQALEEQLTRIIRLAESLEYIKKGNVTSTDNEESNVYDKHKVMKLKKYLKWVLITLKNKIWLKQSNVEEETRYLGNSFIKDLNNIEKKLEQNISYKIASTLQLRNRAGRTAERVGNRPTIFDYGIFLEESITFHDCFVYGSGYHFSPRKIVVYIKQHNPGFISKVIMNSLNLLRNSFPGCNFKENLGHILNSIEMLISQSCNNVSIENLKAFALLYDISLTLNDTMLSHRLLSMAIRMAYSLRIDKIQLDDKSMLMPYKEYKQLVELRRLWLLLSIGASFIHNFSESPPIMTFHTITQTEIKNFNYLNNLDTSLSLNSNSNHKGCKSIFSFINNQGLKMFSLIFEHLQFNIPERDNQNLSPYSQICLPNDKFNEAQALLNKYNNLSTTFINDEFKRQSKNEAIIIERYLCKFPKNYKCKLKAVHEIGMSSFFYVYQSYLIYPTVLRTPYQLDIPLDKIILLLEVSLKLALIFRTIVYIYFETILNQMEPNLDSEMEIYNDFKHFLDSRPRPLIKGNEYYYFYLMRVRTFTDSFIAFYSLLQIASSLEYHNSELYNEHSIALIKFNIIEFIEIYKLAYKLKDDYLRINIDFVTNKIKQVVPCFNILPEYQLKWSTLLKDF